MELTPLRYFCAIAHAGHITRAARSLGVTQPALSAMLTKLERELGAHLFHRTGRGVELTEAGRSFLTHADHTLRAADEGRAAVRELLGLERGLIRIGAGATACSYLLPPVIGALRRDRPGLRFSVREAGSSLVAQAVAAAELDLGIVTLPLSLPDADALIRVPLVEDELRLITPPSPTNIQPPSRPSPSARALTPASALPAPRADQSAFRWSELAGVPVVGFEAGTAVRQLIDRAAAADGVSLDYVMELRSIESIKRMVAASIGVGFVSRFALPPSDPASPGRACSNAALTRSLAIVRRADRQPSPAVAEFERRLLDALRSAPRSAPLQPRSSPATRKTRRR